MTKLSYQERQVMMKNDYEIFHYCDNYLKEVELHHHDFYEMYYFISGEVSYDIEGRSYQLCSGDILLISPDELHQPIIKNGESYERIVLWISNKFIEELSKKADLSKCFKLMKHSSRNLLRLEPREAAEIKEILENIFKTNIYKEFGYITYAESLIQVMLIQLARLIEKSPETVIMYHTSSKLIYSVLQYIDKNLCEPLMLEEIADTFFINKFYLAHEFRKNMGTTVYHYITQKRLILAKELILKGIPIKTVYVECGYQDSSSFFRMFKKEYGITPKEYLRLMQPIR